MPAIGAAATWSAAAAVVDLRRHRLPDLLVVGVVVAAWVPVVAGHLAAFATGGPLPWWPAIAVVFGGLGGGIPLLVVHLRRGVGLGDVKYGAALGMAGGLFDPRIGLVSVGLAAAAAGSVGLVLGIRRMAFGPWLATSWLVALTVLGSGRVLAG